MSSSPGMSFLAPEIDYSGLAMGGSGMRLAAFNLREIQGGSGWSRSRIGDFGESRVSPKFTGSP